MTKKQAEFMSMCFTFAVVIAATAIVVQGI